MRPHVTCLMLGSVDGRLHPSRYSDSPDGDRKAWTEAYEGLHDRLAADAWLVGRTTMAEMSKAEAHPPATFAPPPWPVFRAPDAAPTFAVAVDTGGKVHFAGPSVGGDSAVVLLGPDVRDAHLAELVADGVSYVVAEGAFDLAAAVETLGREFGIRRLMLEGGATVNGSFFAAGLVDEFDVLIAPALDGRPESEAIVEHEGGLKGRTALSLLAAETLPHGVVRLRYAVRAA